MADPVKEVVNVAKDVATKPLKWFSGNKIAFLIFVFIVICFAIRFRDQIAALIYKAGPPGRWVVGKLNSQPAGAA
jgi:hypothetical protein